MGTDHGKNKVRIPLRKPKSLEQSSKTTVLDKQKRTQTSKSSSNMSDKQKRRQIKTSSKKTTITDTQKQGQVFPRYDLFEKRKDEGRAPSKLLTPKNGNKKVSPGSRGKKQSRNRKKQAQPDVDYIIKPLYILPEGAKTKKKKGVMV
tara:strand:+ start:86 stop:526 length:441 start_codon:yes stop_codon:yes gene_type:complete